MPLNKKLYAITAPILYRDVTLDPSKSRTILDGLPVGRFVPPLSSRSTRPPFNRKRELLKLIKVLTVVQHDHTCPTARLSDAGKLEYLLPNVQILRRDFHAADLPDCSLISNRVISPKGLLWIIPSLYYDPNLIDVLARSRGFAADMAISVGHEPRTAAWTSKLLGHPVRRYQHSSKHHTTIFVRPFFSDSVLQGVELLHFQRFLLEFAKLVYGLEGRFTIVGIERSSGYPEHSQDLSPSDSGIQNAQSHAIAWKSSNMYERLKDEYVKLSLGASPAKTAASRNIAAKAFEEITWNSLEDYFAQHPHKEIMSRQTIRAWIEEDPAMYTNLQGDGLDVPKEQMRLDNAAKSQSGQGVGLGGEATRD